MPPLKTRPELVRNAIRKARRIVAMLQGTMALEGQGLDKQTLRAMKKRTIRELLSSGQEPS